MRNKNQGAIEAAIAEAEGAKRRREFLELTVRREVASAYAQYNSTARAAEIFRVGVKDQANANLDVVRQTYELGSKTLIDYLGEQRRFIDLQNGYIDALLDTYKARVEIERAVASPIATQTAGDTEMNEPEETKKQTASAANGHNENRSKKTAVVAVIAVVAVAAIALLLWLFIPRGSGGRPVPAPRNIGPDQTSNQGNNPTSGESTLTLAPEQAQRAGIKIETVGERMSAEATGQQTTGVVQANAYRETPVMSLVGGIVRSVGPELGQSVRKGQTVAVVSSNDLADAQSKYLAAVAELEEHHKHHARTEKLVEIGGQPRGVRAGNQQVESSGVGISQSTPTTLASGFEFSTSQCASFYITGQFRSELTGACFRYCNQSHR